FSLVSDRSIVPPYGVQGGGSGTPNRYAIDHAGQERPLATPGKASGVPLVANDVIIARTSGGGGYGDPFEREPERVAADVAQGFLSVEAARRHYGVAVAADGTLDLPGTQALRAGPRDRGARLRVVAEPDSLVGDLGRHRVFRLHAGTAAHCDLADGDLAELLGAHAAPLRGWIMTAPD